MFFHQALNRNFVVFLADIIYIVASLCFSFLIDWMSVTRVYAVVEKHGSVSA